MSDQTTQSNASWGGRFAAPLAADALAYSDSQKFDRALYAQDIAASKAHAAMLGEQKILPQKDVDDICRGLDQILQEIDSGQFTWKSELEDVHMNIEARLTQIIGQAGKKLHTARSRNDQVGLTYRLFVAGHVDVWRRKTAALCRVFRDQAGQHIATIMPGLTHFQPAQPVSLAQHLLAYASMFRRDFERMTDALARIRVSPLGAAALAGTTYPVNPARVAQILDLPNIYANSMDAVSDRDFVLEALFCASMLALHLSRFCEELIIWSNPAFGYVLLPDAYSTGSSIMPQKKNPDMAELMRGKTGRVFGALMAMLTTMKGLPLAYNRDMQEDKEGFLDADKTISNSLDIMASMLAQIVFQPQKMAQACQRGYLNATELADYLVSRGIPFRDAHHITGELVAYAEKKGLPLENLTLEEFQRVDGHIDRDVYAVLDYQVCVSRRESPGGTGPNSVRQQLQAFDDWFAQISLPLDKK